MPFYFFCLALIIFIASSLIKEDLSSDDDVPKQHLVSRSTLYSIKMRMEKIG
jgi:hypothetical protein